MTGSLLARLGTIKAFWQQRQWRVAEGGFWDARLRDYSDDVWRFMTQADVPFTNNLAEQTVRMPKVKQKSQADFVRCKEEFMRVRCPGFERLRSMTDSCCPVQP